MPMPPIAPNKPLCRADKQLVLGEVLTSFGGDRSSRVARHPTDSAPTAGPQIFVDFCRRPGGFGEFRGFHCMPLSHGAGPAAAAAAGCQRSQWRCFVSGDDRAASQRWDGGEPTRAGERRELRIAARVGLSPLSVRQCAISAADQRF